MVLSPRLDAAAVGRAICAAADFHTQIRRAAAGPVDRVVAAGEADVVDAAAESAGKLTPHPS
jgi:hypothetical protein